jgi:AcrR family transcriptional regulator
MQVKDRDRRSFTASARRAQILRAAIETVAELGFPGASFARIAERAGLSSTRLISYHFAGKSELVVAMVTEVVSALGQFVGERVRSEATPGGALRAYLAANIEFTAAHRCEMKALLAIFTSGNLSPDAMQQAEVLAPLESMLRAGQASGDFRSFDVTVMASVVQRCIEALPFLWESHPDIDPGTYAAEITAFVDLATRRAP